MITTRRLRFASLLALIRVLLVGELSPVQAQDLLQRVDRWRLRRIDGRASLSTSPEPKPVAQQSVQWITTPSIMREAQTDSDTNTPVLPSTSGTTLRAAAQYSPGYSGSVASPGSTVFPGSPTFPGTSGIPTTPSFPAIPPQPQPPQATSGQTPIPAQDDTAAEEFSGTYVGIDTRPRRLAFFVDAQYGYDKQQVLYVTPEPVLFDVRRQIRSFVVTGQYMISPNTSVGLSVPYIYQTTRSSASVGSFSQRGKGIGDIGVMVEQRFPEVSRGTELALALGMVMPTGTDPYEAGLDDLPTGVGFYQPVARVSVSKMRVPLQLYAALDYGTSLARTIDGQRTRLPDSYGGEFGFLYAIGPEFSTRTSLSWARISSPFFFDTGSSIGYLSQALTYHRGDRTSVRGSVHVGLTDAATDVSLGLSVNNAF